MAPPIPKRVAARAHSKWAPRDDCRISTYSVGSHGYAQLGWTQDGKTYMTTAHRAAWVMVNGQVPDGLTIDHLCKERRCVNVKHMRLLSNYENARRTRGRDWPLGFCVNGHPNSESYVRPSGRRICGPCNRAAQAAYKARQRAKGAKGAKGAKDASGTPERERVDVRRRPPTG